MKTREELNTEIQLEILQELQKKNETPEPQLSKEQRRFNAMQKLMNSGSTFTAKAEQREQLAASYKKRYA